MSMIPGMSAMMTKGREHESQVLYLFMERVSGRERAREEGREMTEGCEHQSLVVDLSLNPCKTGGREGVMTSYLRARELCARARVYVYV